MNNRSEPAGGATLGPEAGVPGAAASMPNDAVVLLAEPRRRHALGYLTEFDPVR